MYPIKTTKLYDPAHLELSADVYSTVYLGNYLAGDYDEGGGSHPGVDIVPTTPLTSVVAIFPGVVLQAANNQSEGNYVVIEHTNMEFEWEMGTFVSSYLHLSELLVSKGDQLIAGTPIGRTGNTGMSTGEHLHFQVDRGIAPFHPYWPFNFKEARDLGLGFMEAVNRGLGAENARKYTVNPLIFAQNAQYRWVSKDTPISRVTPLSTWLSADAPPVRDTRIAASVSSSVFSDVSREHPNATAIAWVQSRGIVTGQNGKFYPSRSVSRAEILKMAYAASGTALIVDATPHFIDVPAGHSMQSYINTARAQGVVGGYSDRTFRPDASVTRAEGLKIVLTILSVSLEQVDGPVYIDVGRQDWVAPFALWSRDTEALRLNNNHFQPNTPLTRGEVAQIIYQAIEK